MRILFFTLLVTFFLGTSALAEDAMLGQKLTSATAKLNSILPEAWKNGIPDALLVAAIYGKDAQSIADIEFWQKDTIGHLPQLCQLFQVFKEYCNGKYENYELLFHMLPSEQDRMVTLADICKEQGYPVLEDYFRHFKECRELSRYGRPGMKRWLPTWNTVTPAARKLLYPILMLGFSGGVMGRSASRPGDLQLVAWNAFLENPKNATPCFELALWLVAQSPTTQRRQFFSLQNMEQVKQSAGSDAALAFARIVPELLPGDPTALVTSASFLLQYASVEDGIRTFSEAENRLPPVDAQRVRLALYLALWRYSRSTQTPELFDAEVTHRRQLSLQKPEDYKVRLGWADALSFKAKQVPDARETLASQAAAIYDTILEHTADRELKQASLYGLCETDPVHALQSARPVVEAITQGTEAMAVGECLQNALHHGLLTLSKRAEGHTEDPSLPTVAREGANLLLHLIPADRRAPEIFLARTTSCLMLAGDQQAAVKFFSEQLASQPRLRRREPNNVATIFAHLSVAARPHTLALDTGLYFLDHLATAPPNVEPSVQGELCQIWGEFLFRSLLLFRDTIFTEGAQHPMTITQEERTQDISRMKDILEARLQGPQRAMLAPIIREQIDGQLPIIEIHDPVLAAALQQIRALAIDAK